MENCLEEVPHGSQDYYPHYNLFQSSIFYDTDNFRVEYLSLHYDDDLSAERRAEPPDKSPEEIVDSVVQEKRFVNRDDLYKDPELFQSKMEDVQPPQSEPSYLKESQPWGYDWTKQSWVKGGGTAMVMSKKLPKQKRKPSHNPLKVLQNAPRISISKAESMMQKMGWQGGALGKAADGTLDPVTPDPLYGSSNAGFGQRTRHPPSAPPKRGSNKDHLRHNVLLQLLDFVRDDTEIELHFDVRLRQNERRVIHNFIYDATHEASLLALASTAQYGLLAEISQHNRWELGTVSDGEHPNRQMTLYKEPPENVYLVTPDDFLPISDDATTDKPTPDIENDGATKDLSNDTAKAKQTLDARAMEVDDDENPFLKSIKKSVRKDDEPITNTFEKDCSIAEEMADDTPRGKMVEFFLEFVDSAYSELRFLGKFTAEQMAGINEFLDDIAECIDDVGSFKGSRDIADAFRSGNAGYELKEGCNGTIEIHKKLTSI